MPRKTKVEEGEGKAGKRGADGDGVKDSDVKKQKVATAGGAKMNKTETDLDSLVLLTHKKAPSGGSCNFKICSWNVAGIRAVVKKNGVAYLKKESPDILCLQETKCSENDLPHEVKLPGYHAYWCSGSKKGYAGVVLYSKEEPLNVKYGLGDEKFDDEGRLITAEYEKFYLVTTYVPNAGEGLKTLPKRLEWDKKFRKHMKKLDSSKPVILCGDLNVAHEPIDLANPKTNTMRAGFTKEEREGFTQLLQEGFVDSFRKLYPDKEGAYTYWTYFANARSRNAGWRLDYYVLSERLMDSVCDNVMRTEVFGSDHCPIVLYISL